MSEAQARQAAGRAAPLPATPEEANREVRMIYAAVFSRDPGTRVVLDPGVDTFSIDISKREIHVPARWNVGRLLSSFLAHENMHVVVTPGNELRAIVITAKIAALAKSMGAPIHITHHVVNIVEDMIGDTAAYHRGVKIIADRAPAWVEKAAEAAGGLEHVVEDPALAAKLAVLMVLHGDWDIDRLEEKLRSLGARRDVAYAAARAARIALHSWVAYSSPETHAYVARPLVEWYARNSSRGHTCDPEGSARVTVTPAGLEAAASMLEPAEIEALSELYPEAFKQYGRWVRSLLTLPGRRGARFAGVKRRAPLWLEPVGEVDEDDVVAGVRPLLRRVEVREPARRRRRGRGGEEPPEKIVAVIDTSDSTLQPFTGETIVRSIEYRVVRGVIEAVRMVGGCRRLSLVGFAEAPRVTYDGPTPGEPKLSRLVFSTRGIGDLTNLHSAIYVAGRLVDRSAALVAVTDMLITDRDASETVKILSSLFSSGRLRLAVFVVVVNPSEYAAAVEALKAFKQLPRDRTVVAAITNVKSATAVLRRVAQTVLRLYTGEG